MTSNLDYTTIFLYFTVSNLARTNTNEENTRVDAATKVHSNSNYYGLVTCTLSTRKNPVAAERFNAQRAGHMFDVHVGLLNNEWFNDAC